MKILNTVLDIIFPVNCIACGKNGADLCQKCFFDCPAAERESAKWIFPIFEYRHPPVKKAIWLLKYKSKKGIINIFTEAMYGKIVEELSELSQMENFRDPILIPIPLSPKRKRERGFNQAELLCKKLIELDNNTQNDTRLNLKLETNVLIKPKDTEHQARIKDRQKRLKNLTGSFSVKNKEKIIGKNIILIDDVSTTGATFNEARKTLKQAGARKIIAFAIAH
ncbi:MAG: phosphoribosyltransferase family protein [Minisyncoccia bacterium]